jgi:hypothetical protein
MQVDIQKREEVSAIYLQHLKDFPGEVMFKEVIVIAVMVIGISFIESKSLRLTLLSHDH